jgi:putative glutamine amidotransferase
MRIGIVAQEHGEIFGVHRDYLEFIEEFGTPVILTPLEKNDFFRTVKIDGLVLPGGSDVNPRRYSRLPSFMSYRPNSYLELFDKEILPGLISKDFPIFGICRGLQTLNVHFGGSLHQHLFFHPYSKNNQDLVHELTFISPTKTGGEPTGEDCKVNSFHHQAISRLAKDLEVLAISNTGTIYGYSIIEAVRHLSLPIVAVQWHPERIHDIWSMNAMKILFNL